MKKKLVYAGIVSMVLAAVIAILGINKIETSFSEPLLTNIQIYPALFFLFLGFVLAFLGVKPVLRN